MTGIKFITFCYTYSCLYDGPTPMTIEEAAYNLEQYRSEGEKIPDDVTPELFCEVWNSLYDRDMKGE